MKKISDIPEAERPREKLIARGARTLADDELLAVLLGRGTKNQDVLALSRRLIKIIDCKGLELRAGDVMDIDGIGTARAALIMAAFEFVRRRIRPEGLKIQSPPDVLPLIRHYGDRKQEHFLCVSLNGANEVMNVRVITIGLADKSHVHPREVFADVIVDRASAVIFAHNHPSGDLTPSPQDRAVTKQLREAGRILGIAVLDHIIFTDKGYYSFMERHE
ncbi:MAG: DNA repair protein RadC [Thermodesulfobacteriota bacterium]|nr:DNA repair protein RadC [Thermodesulfobacteriota bacterium]